MKVEVEYVSEPEPDLSKLTDAQLRMFEMLLAITRGQKPPTVARTHASARWHDVRRLIRLLDNAQERGDKLRENETTELRNLIGSLLFPVIPPYQLFEAALQPTPAEPAAAPSRRRRPARQRHHARLSRTHPAAISRRTWCRCKSL